MEFLGDFFYGVWYYTSIKSIKIKKLKKFGWNFIQKMCFFCIFLVMNS
jgi:hypothetical protein